MQEPAGSSVDAAARDRGIRRARRLRSGIVAAGVAGSLGLTGVAAANTITTRQSTTSSSSGSSTAQTRQQPNTGENEGGGSGSDDGGQAAQQQTQQRPRRHHRRRQFTPAPAPSASTQQVTPNATSSGS